LIDGRLPDAQAGGSQAVQRCDQTEGAGDQVSFQGRFSVPRSRPQSKHATAKVTGRPMKGKLELCPATSNASAPFGCLICIGNAISRRSDPHFTVASPAAL
jgi:hypothetical protein